MLPHLRETGVRCPQHRRHPLTLWVKRGAPSSSGLLWAHHGTQTRSELITRAITPASFTGVRQKDHWAHDAVGKRIGIAVRVISDGARVTIAIGRVANKRNCRVIGAERRTG